MLTSALSLILLDVSLLGKGVTLEKKVLQADSRTGMKGFPAEKREIEETMPEEMDSQACTSGRRSYVVALPSLTLWSQEK